MVSKIKFTLVIIQNDDNYYNNDYKNYNNDNNNCSNERQQ